MYHVYERKPDMNKEFSIVQFLRKAAENLWLFVCLTILCASMLFAYSRFVATPMYTSTAKMLANNKTLDQNSEVISSSDISARTSLVNTYGQIIKSNTLMTMVCNKVELYKSVPGYEFLIGCQHTPKDLAKSIKVAAIDDTEVFSISLTLADPLEAQFMVDAITEFLPDMVEEKMKSSSTTLIDSADLPTSPSSPHVFRNTVIGGLIGFVIAAAIVLIITFTDTVIHTEEDLTESFGDITLLGTIPLIFNDSEKSSTETKARE